MRLAHLLLCLLVLGAAQRRSASQTPSSAAVACDCASFESSDAATNTSACVTCIDLAGQNKCECFYCAIAQNNFRCANQATGSACLKSPDPNAAAPLPTNETIFEKKCEAWKNSLAPKETNFFILLDPATFLLLFTSFFSLYLGAKLSAHEYFSNPRQAQDVAASVSKGPLKYLIFFIIPCIASGSLIVLFFFSKYAYYVLLCILSLAALSSTFGIAYLSMGLAGDRAPRSAIRLGAAALFMLVACGGWAATNYFIFINVIATCLAVAALTSHVGQMRYITLLNIGFFVYDIFWVFVSPLLFEKSVMISVAQTVVQRAADCSSSTFHFGHLCRPSLPILWIFPRLIFSDYSASILGVGDVVLPGFFLCFLNKFDFKYAETKPFSQKRRITYFRVAFVGYALGLILTLIIAYTFGSGQPALLYLVPCTQLPILFLARKRGDLQTMWKGLPKGKEFSIEALLSDDANGDDEIPTVFNHSGHYEL